MNNKFAILSEVFIKSKCSRNFEPFHYNKRGAIGEAITFVIISLEDFSRFGYIFIGDFNDIDYLRVKHLLSDFYRLMVTKALFNQI